MKRSLNRLAARLAAGLAFVAVAAACSDDPVAPFAAETDADLSFAGSRLLVPVDVTFMSRNVYIGANADAAIAALADADPTNDLPALLAAIETLRVTSFSRRAKALAAEIARGRPHFIGLQEVSEIDIQIPPLGISLSLDFLAILQTELEARGLHYVVAAQVENFTVSLTPIPGSTVAVADSDVILVDARRVTFDPATAVARTYSNNIGPVAPGVNVIRGFVAITAQVRGKTFIVANTHLESGNSNPMLPFLRAAQATELVGVLGVSNPAIIMGDLNDIPGSPMYQVLAGAGFADVWGEVNPTQDGFTCCHAPDLSNSTARGFLNQRIDYVLVRGAPEHEGRIMARAELVGSRSRERIAGPTHDLWPSDHAGVLAQIRLGRQ